MTRRLLTLTQAADDLGQPTSFVRALIADGLVRGEKRRGRWYVTERSLEHWVETGEPEPERSAPVAVAPEVVTPMRRRVA